MPLHTHLSRYLLPADADGNSSSSTFMVCLKPSPTLPTRCLSGIMQLSKIISAVSLCTHSKLIFFLPPRNRACFFSIINVVEFISCSWLTGSRNYYGNIAGNAMLSSILFHLKIQLSPSFVAVHFILPASLPVLGSG